MGVETMAKKRKEEVEAPPDHTTAVTVEVFKLLGRPRDLLKVTCVNVYHNRYRVNVFRHTEVDDRNHITDTHFVVYDPEKGIIEARPPIEKKY